jgi:hypothetical protein
VLTAYRQQIAAALACAHRKVDCHAYSLRGESPYGVHLILCDLCSLPRPLRPVVMTAREQHGGGRTGIERSRIVWANQKTSPLCGVLAAASNAPG